MSPVAKLMIDDLEEAVLKASDKFKKQMSIEFPNKEFNIKSYGIAIEDDNPECLDITIKSSLDISPCYKN